MVIAEEINSLSQFCETLEMLNTGSFGDLVLFRGQSNHQGNLLPSIARNVQGLNVLDIEKKMFDQVKLLGVNMLTDVHDDWSVLIEAQHHSLKTRCLDWTSNPLIALWFACHETVTCNTCAHLHDDGYGYVYALIADKAPRAVMQISPFEQGGICIYQPNHEISRVSSQHGWLTIHNSIDNQFQSVDEFDNDSMPILEFSIPNSAKQRILFALDRCGINERTVFPDLDHLCKYLNTKAVFS